MQWLRKVRESVPMQLQPEKLLRLLDHDDPEVRIRADLHPPGLKPCRSPLLQLLKTKSGGTETISPGGKKHVSGDRSS
jgi:hypothetical protein